MASDALAGAVVVTLFILDVCLDSTHCRHKAPDCRGCRLRVTLEDTLLGLSDTQLIASLAMLIARQTQLCQLPVYYYNMVIYYVLIASFAHAATLLMLPKKLRTTPFRVLFRIVLLVAVTIFASITVSLPVGGKGFPMGNDPSVAFQVECYRLGLAPEPSSTDNSSIVTLTLIVLMVFLLVSSLIGMIAPIRMKLDSIPSTGYITRICLQIFGPLCAASYGWGKLVQDRQAAWYDPGTSGKIKLSDNSQNEWAFGQVLAMINVGFALLFTLNNFPREHI